MAFAKRTPTIRFPAAFFELRLGLRQQGGAFGAVSFGMAVSHAPSRVLRRWAVLFAGGRAGAEARILLGAGFAGLKPGASTVSSRSEDGIGMDRGRKYSMRTIDRGLICVAQERFRWMM
jgi:hypothetical protein